MEGPSSTLFLDPHWAVRTAAEFVKDRATMQQEYMQTICCQLGGNRRRHRAAPRDGSHGMPILQCLCDAVLAADAKPTSVIEVGQPHEIEP